MNHRYYKFGSTGLELYRLGVGTLWFGRRWPMDNRVYEFPEKNEVADYLDLAFERAANRDGVILIDTAAAYGFSEERIGEYFEGHPGQFQKAFITTKWGEDFDLDEERSVYDHSVQGLKRSAARSLERLGKIDMLLIHGTTLEVLRDAAVINELRHMKISGYGGLRFAGASVSREDVLEQALGEDLLGFADAVQLPADLFLKRPDLARPLHEQGKALMLNSIVRNAAAPFGKSPEQAFRELLAHEVPALLLVGTRHHLNETLGYTVQ